MNDMKSFINKLKNRFELVLFRARGALAQVQGRPLHTLWRHRVAVAILLVVGVFGVELGILKLPEVNAAYTISNSARFISGNSDYLSKTLTTPTNNKIWTYSAWVKRGRIGSAVIDELITAGGNNGVFGFFGDQLEYYEWNGSTVTSELATNALYRDPAAWYHIVFAVDTTQATAANRYKLYVNGTQITSFSTATYPTQNYNTYTNSAIAHYVGFESVDVRYFDGYMADAYLVDGQALDPTSFGATDANGYWRPKAYTGTYGTNGFHLAFGNGAALGTDTSGAGNNFTVNNLTATDQVIDTPTNSFATLSPLITPVIFTLSRGNLNVTKSAASNVPNAWGAWQITSGKWYWEMTVNSASSLYIYFGVGRGTLSGSYDSGYAMYADDGSKYNSLGLSPSSGAYGATYGTGDVIGAAFDAGAGQITFYKNGVSQGVAYTGLTGAFYPWIASDGVNNSLNADFNFGQGGQSGLTFDAASGGTFKYTPPSGFKALSTANLPVPTIAVPKNYFDALTYTGTGVASNYGSNLAYFTSTGTTTWTVPQGVTSVSVLAVAGGGGGGGGNTASTVGNGGGGGGGGVVYNSSYSVTPGQIITVAVGAGGSAGGAGGGDGTNGVSSAFGTMVANGGGFGGTYNATSVSGGSGGSGGGGQNNGGTTAGGSATQGNSGGGTGYGNVGGASSAVTSWGSGGGGGAGAVGAVGTGAGGGAGGIGKLASTFDARFPAKYYGGGGGGGAYSAGGGAGGAGGNGGGGAGAASGTGTAGSANTGGGGGGGGNSGGQASAGGVGGSGIVIVSYTANSSTIGFTPDLVWIKDRTSALMHNIFDSVRSVIPYWSSNSSAAEAVASNALTAFLSNGFSLGTNSLFNTSGNNYVAWLWKKSPTTDGVDIIAYTGDDVNGRALAHSLGAVPDMVIVKERSEARLATVYHTALGFSTQLILGSTAAAGADTAGRVGNASASTITLTAATTNENVNKAGQAYVAYLFKGIDGFSKFGSYTGNGSTDGPFVYTGFKPRYVLVKRIDTSGGEWAVHDSAQDPYNPVAQILDLDSNAANAGGGTARYDFLSNGFKLRTTGGDYNTSSGTYIYAAFADIPFQQSAQPYNLTIASSTRFISGNSDSLTRSVTASNQKTFTVSVWAKRGTLGTPQYLFNGSSSQGGGLNFGACTNADTISVGFNGSCVLETSAVFRDPSSWLHIVLAVDTTQATAANRIKLYINGIQQTSFSTASYPSQNTDLNWDGTNTMSIGKVFGSTYFFDGYMADMYNIDGQQLDPSNFAEYDTNGYWRPKAYSGTYGTNGFHLPLTTTSPGTDTSGNSNTFTASGLASTDNVKDSPTNSFPTLNPISNSGVSGSFTASNGNLALTVTNNSGYRQYEGTLWPDNLKGYYEVAFTSGTPNAKIGFEDRTKTMSNSSYSSSGTFDIDVASSGEVYNGGSALTSGYLSTFSAGDTLMVAFDFTNGSKNVWFGKNGTWGTNGGVGNPATGANPALTASNLTGNYRFYFTSNTGGGTQINTYDFGQGGQASLTYDSASGGYFKYTPPSGFKALSTANLPAPTIAVPKNYFDALTYTGTGASQSISTSTGATRTVTFTASGTTSWTVPPNVISVNVLVVGGGGGGGGSDQRGGGGGAGALIASSYATTPGASITVTVGAGGAGGTTGVGTNGGNSVFGTITATGGGGGGGGTAGNSSAVAGASGGSGGGGASFNTGSGSGGSGTTGGNSGGTGFYGATPYGGGGGGGAGAVGTNAASGVLGTGGAGLASSISGTSVTYAGGGGGGANTGGVASGGSGGGGAGSAPSVSASNGTANTGGGGGGGANSLPTGGNGGSGIVVISYVPQIAFQPDLVWIKDRTTTNAHGIFDSARTVIPAWTSNGSNAEGGAGGTSLTGFLSSGFSLGASSTVNTLGDNFVAWLWKRCPTALFTLSCTAANGVDIVTYTGDNTSNRTISHSLGAAPEFAIIKRRDAAADPFVWHTSLTGAAYFLLMDSSAAQTNTNTPWGTGGWTSSTFMVTNNATNNANASGATYVAYLFKGIDGFSKFGIYTGNNSADGPFVYTGFKPRYVMIKYSSGSGAWAIFDSARETYNVMGTDILLAQTSAASTNFPEIDFLSNGFKIRANDVNSYMNASGGTYIYAAFADQPFYYSAQPAASTQVFSNAASFLMGMTY